MVHSKLPLLLVGIGLVLTVSGSVAAQSLREQARQSGGKPVGSGLLRDICPKSLEDLTTESGVVLIATVSKGKSYLTPNEEHVYTDYTVSPRRVVAGSYPLLSGVPVATMPLTITQYGGEMILEGVVVRSQNYNYPDWGNGEYLLFLKDLARSLDGTRSTMEACSRSRRTPCDRS